MKNQILSTHPLQSSQWGDFRKKTDVKVIEEEKFLLTIHKIPHTSWTIGYIPKGNFPTKGIINRLKEIGKREKCIFIQLEPNVIGNKDLVEKAKILGLNSSIRPLFTKYTFMLNLRITEEGLLKNMNSKTRYNIRVAQKHGVKIIEDNSDKAFEKYLALMNETVNRQKFYSHDNNYHRLMWKTLKPPVSNDRPPDLNRLTAHLFLAKYKDEILASWILFVYKDALYYPYGASSNLYRNTMASNLMMWEAILYGKKLGLRYFDMWGALGGSILNKNDPWYGFHRFKQGYGGELIEFIGSFDLIINPVLYFAYDILDKIRWLILKFRK